MTTEVSRGCMNLRVGPSEAPLIAIECVGAVDPVSTETWNVGPARGPRYFDIRGDWIVEIAYDANVRSIEKELRILLLYFEAAGVRGGQSVCALANQ
jgi:hypothetical protein